MPHNPYGQTLHQSAPPGPRPGRGARPAADRRRASRRSRTGTRSGSSGPIRNVNRTVGTMLGSAVTKAVGRRRAARTTRSQIHFRGSAGQSFGAFVPRGITLRLEGDANDYLGKGLSRRPSDRATPTVAPRSSPRRTSSPATSSATARRAARSSSAGVVGERFCVRNSGATAVVEGVGDHGCEYMTGGRVVVLGRDRAQLRGRHERRHRLRVRPRRLVPRHGEHGDGRPRTARRRRRRVPALDRRHAMHSSPSRRSPAASSTTGSSRSPRFVKVMPRDYKRVLGVMQQAEHDGLSPDETATRVMESI